MLLVIYLIPLNAIFSTFFIHDVVVIIYCTDPMSFIMKPLPLHSLSPKTTCSILFLLNVSSIYYSNKLLITNRINYNNTMKCSVRQSDAIFILSYRFIIRHTSFTCLKPSTHNLPLH